MTQNPVLIPKKTFSVHLDPSVRRERGDSQSCLAVEKSTRFVLVASNLKPIHDVLGTERVKRSVLSGTAF